MIVYIVNCIHHKYIRLHLIYIIIMRDSVSYRSFLCSVTCSFFRRLDVVSIARGILG